jgi:Cache domain
MEILINNKNISQTMTKKLHLIVMSCLFLLTGVSAITIISVPTTNTFSLVHENQNSDMPFTNNATKSQLNVIANSTFLKQLGLYTLSQHLSNTVSNIMAIAEASMNGSNSFGKLPQVNVTSEMKIKYHGIPSDQDLEKRFEARDLLSNNRALLYVGLLLPNGDRYFGEPYSPYQTNSSISNFAYRDHFIGALETKQPYLSNVINAVSTGKPLAILANPIYSDAKNHNSLIGLQVLGLDFTYFNDLIKSTMPTEEGDKRAVIVDNNGTEIADSSSDNNNMESLKKLQSFQNARNGESGLLTEEVNGKNTSISYTPIKFAQTNWIVLLLSSK